MTEQRLNSIWRGELVLLRAKTTRDVERFLADGIVDDMRLYGDGYIPFPVSDAQRREWMEKDTGFVAGEAASLAIENADGELVGSINAVDCDRRAGLLWYGIAIFAGHRQRGYALDAVRILLRHYFEERGYHRAGARVYAFNEPSILLQEKLGFSLEGRQRESVLTGGERHDLLLYGMLAEEFFSKWGKRRVG